LWRAQFGHDTIAVGDEYGFASCDDTHILAELVFEHFEADCSLDST